MGIKCSPNFDLPYFSYNIKDFWRRWHISLSSWLKDYIYIPLGENPDLTDYILACNGNRPALEYYKLKYLLDHNVKIENLYVDMYVYSAWESLKNRQCFL